MAVTVTHATVATLPDDPDAEVGTDEWNAGHTVTNAMDKTLFDAKGDLIAASAADTPAKVTVGANDTILMADSAQTAGLKWVASQTPSTQAFSDAAAEGTADTFARGDHKHAMPALSGTEYDLTGGADVTLVNSNTYYTVKSQSLVAGTYLLLGNASGARSSVGWITMRLWDGASAIYGETQGYIFADYAAVPLAATAIVTLGSTTTVYMSAATSVTGSTGWISPTAATNGTTDKLTRLIAVRLA